jgi:hypothetical protein
MFAAPPMQGIERSHRTDPARAPRASPIFGSNGFLRLVPSHLLLSSLMQDFAAIRHRPAFGIVVGMVSPSAKPLMHSYVLALGVPLPPALVEGPMQSLRRQIAEEEVGFLNIKVRLDSPWEVGHLQV